AQHFETMLARRIAGEPVGRIIGHRDFWGISFQLSPDTLEPRPDSETLIEAALEALGPRKNAPLTILDLGTGTGCLLIALMSECASARGIGVDVSIGALRTARANAEAAGVGKRCHWIASDWDAALSVKADVILSNPPYIASSEVAGLAPAVRVHDPMRALDGGADGLVAYRRLGQALPHLLADEGLAVIELGIGQEAPVSDLSEAQGLTVVSCRKDLGGVPRALMLRLAGSGPRASSK
ncbi:MAG: peptide chain release factor N(5)-glutamine methyltransferase, partial [Bosea sp. (in: a-proteobacteria)]